MELPQRKRPPVARTGDSADRLLDRVDEPVVDQTRDGPPELLAAHDPDVVIPRSEFGETGDASADVFGQLIRRRRMPAI